MGGRSMSPIETVAAVITVYVMLFVTRKTTI
jgi:hypothetical protein